VAFEGGIAHRGARLSEGSLSVDLDGAGKPYPRFADALRNETERMLIVFGLLHTRRFHAFIVLLCGVALLSWGQRLLPEGQVTLDPRQVVASAWIHQLPLVAFGLGAQATKRLEADAQAHQAEAQGPTWLLFQPGEGWFPDLSFELPQAER
jgi:hypothetical protein